MSPEQSLTSFAVRQHGVFTRRDATRLGFTPYMIRSRVRNGRWVALTQEVFALAAAPVTWRQRCAAATAVHPAGALSHRTAAAHRGLDGFRPGKVEVTVPVLGSHGSPLSVVHRSRHHQFDLVDGIRTTSFAQTVVQLAASSPFESLEAAIHSGVHRTPADLDALVRRLAELAGRRLPGLGRVAEIVDALEGEPATASELERRLEAIWAKVPGAPTLRRQHRFAWSSERSTIVDAFVEPWALVLEADGRSWHTRVQDFESDRWRDAEAAAHGLLTLRFTARRMAADELGIVSHLTPVGATRRAA